MAKIKIIYNTVPSFKDYLGIIIVLALSFSVNASIEDVQGGTALSLSLWLGLAFGAVLQRSRFCFYCVSRDFIELKDAKGLLGIITALIVGTIGYHLIFGAFLLEPVAPRLPPNAHIAPVSWVLILGSLSFGFGMAIAGSCISAQLYRLGEGLLSAICNLLLALKCRAGVSVRLGSRNVRPLQLSFLDTQRAFASCEQEGVLTSWLDAVAAPSRTYRRCNA